MVPSCAPRRDHGVPLFPGASKARKRWCGRGDLNPHRPCGPTDFLTICGFRRALLERLVRHSRFVVWTIPSPWPLAVGAARLVSTPSRSECSERAWLGIAISQVSPNLSSSASPVSRRALKFRLSPVRLPIPPRPRGWLSTPVYHRAAKRNLHVSSTVVPGQF